MISLFASLIPTFYGCLTFFLFAPPFSTVLVLDFLFGNTQFWPSPVTASVQILLGRTFLFNMLWVPIFCSEYKFKLGLTSQALVLTAWLRFWVPYEQYALSASPVRNASIVLHVCRDLRISVGTPFLYIPCPTYRVHLLCYKSKYRFSMYGSGSIRGKVTYLYFELYSRFAIQRDVDEWNTISARTNVLWTWNSYIATVLCIDVCRMEMMPPTQARQSLGHIPSATQDGYIVTTWAS